VVATDQYGKVEYADTGDDQIDYVEQRLPPNLQVEKYVCKEGDEKGAVGAEGVAE
jgi:hypothetical protein